MFGHWFERELGQLVAPDKNATTGGNGDNGDNGDDAVRESRSSFWQIVAPDPKVQYPDKTPKPKRRKPPLAAFVPSSLHPHAEVGCLVKCIHCRQMTPIHHNDNVDTPSPSKSFVTPKEQLQLQQQPNATFATPHSPSMYHPHPTITTATTTTTTSRLEQAVLSAARETATSMTSPSAVADLRNKVFRLCASSKPLNDKLQGRLRKLVLANPALLTSRSSRLGNLVSDGYTPLMAAASVNNTSALEILLHLDLDHDLSLDETSGGGGGGGSENDSNTNSIQWNDRDLQGRTALHIAAELGHVQAVELLRTIYPDEIGAAAPLDLTGATPLGRALLSKNTVARNHAEELKDSLFSPGDVSVYGDKTPNKKQKQHRPTKGNIQNQQQLLSMSTITMAGTPPRQGEYTILDLWYGWTDMPGFRIAMEDAVCCDTWNDDNSGADNRALFGVFDGHGDDGLVSDFMARQISQVLRDTSEYNHGNYKEALHSACLQLDQTLRKTKKNWQGGSTAVMAFVTKENIIVANVGDSRGILISSSTSNTTAALESSMNKLAVDEKKISSRPPTLVTEEGEPTGSTDKSEIEQVEKVKNETTTTSSTIVVTALSEDHKPDLEAEQARIDKAGLSVVSDTFQEERDQGDGKMATTTITIHKVKLNDSERMAVSRSFGDFEYKANTTLAPEEQAVVPTPDICVHTRNENTDKYLVLACDGIWDVMSNEQVGHFVVDTVREILVAMGDEHEPQQHNQEEDNDILTRVGDLLLRECLDRGSRDNMTVVIVALSKEAAELGRAGMAMVGSGGKELDFTQE